MGAMSLSFGDAWGITVVQNFDEKRRVSLNVCSGRMGMRPFVRSFPHLENGICFVGRKDVVEEFVGLFL